MMDKELNFYRAVGVPEYQNYLRSGYVFSGREWVECNLEMEKQGFSFADIKKIVDVGGWKEGVNYTRDIPRDVIMRVAGLSDKEFQLPKIDFFPARYVNVVNIDFSRVKIVYDPRAAILSEPLCLTERLVPELSMFRVM